MSTLKITSKGQVTLRKDLLNHLGVRPGDTVAINKLPDGTIEVRAAGATGRISDVFGLLKRKRQRPVSIEEINETTSQGWAGKR